MVGKERSAWCRGAGPAPAQPHDSTAVALTEYKGRLILMCPQRLNQRLTLASQVAAVGKGFDHHGERHPCVPKCFQISFVHENTETDGE